MIIDPSYEWALTPNLCPSHINQPHRILCSWVLKFSGVAKVRLYCNMFPGFNDFGEQLQKGLGVWVGGKAVWPVG